MITLATLPQATEQEVFDQIVNHLLTQNKKCMNNENCVYRNEKGLKCAAGCLIADDEYKPEMDDTDSGTNWKTLFNNGLVPNTHLNLIMSLQSIHDNYEPYEWETELIKQSFKRNLNFNYVPSGLREGTPEG